MVEVIFTQNDAIEEYGRAKPSTPIDQFRELVCVQLRGQHQFRSAGRFMAVFPTLNTGKTPAADLRCDAKSVGMPQTAVVH